MTVSSAILRELGAEHRTFRTVKGAMLWYARKVEGLLGRAAPLEFGGSAKSAERKNSDEATRGAISACLVRTHRADRPSDIPLSAGRVAHLIRWYVSDRAQQVLADKLDMTIHQLSKYSGQTEGILRRRMKARGLLVER